jgi:GH15 family glucan-1,4-alpha-glucosidase
MGRTSRDCRSAALVSRYGSIDWLCWPRFDSDAIFAALLDDAGGRWALAPAREFRANRRYIDDTNVLETRFEADGGVLVVTDLMPALSEAQKGRAMTPAHEILRVARCERGEIDVEHGTSRSRCRTTGLPSSHRSDGE